MGRRQGKAATPWILVLFFPRFFATALASQCFLDSLFLTGLQVEGVTLDLLDDVFLLHLTLEATKRVFEGFSLLDSDFCQTDYTPKLVPFGPDSYCKVLLVSQELCNMLAQKTYISSCRNVVSVIKKSVSKQAELVAGRKRR